MGVQRLRLRETLRLPRFARWRKRVSTIFLPVQSRTRRQTWTWRSTFDGPHLKCSPQSRETNVDLQLKGKNAVILGGTRGIGRAIADTLAAEGANVAICARNPDQVKDAVAALKDKGVKATGAA